MAKRKTSTSTADVIATLRHVNKQLDPAAKLAKALLSTDQRATLSDFATQFEEAAGEVKCLGELVMFLGYAVDLAQIERAEAFYGIGHMALNTHRKLQDLVEAMVAWKHGDGAKGGAA